MFGPKPHFTNPNQTLSKTKTNSQSNIPTICCPERSRQSSVTYRIIPPYLSQITHVLTEVVRFRRKHEIIYCLPRRSQLGLPDVLGCFRRVCKVFVMRVSCTLALHSNSTISMTCLNKLFLSNNNTLKFIVSL